MTKKEAQRIGDLFGKLTDQNQAIAYAYASGLLTSQTIQAAKALAKEVSRP